MYNWVSFQTSKGDSLFLSTVSKLKSLTGLQQGRLSDIDVRTNYAILMNGTVMPHIIICDVYQIQGCNKKPQ